MFSNGYPYAREALPDDRIELSMEDIAMLVHMLENPHAPNDALMLAYKKYRKMVENGCIRDSLKCW